MKIHTPFKRLNLSKGVYLHDLLKWQHKKAKKKYLTDIKRRTLDRLTKIDNITQVHTVQKTAKANIVPTFLKNGLKACLYERQV